MNRNNQLTKPFQYSLIFAAIASSSTFAADEPNNSPEGEDVEKILITGSRIENAAPTTQVITINRDDIETRGFSSVEDILKSLPQNFSGMSTATTSNDTAGSTLAQPDRYAGQSSADLRGLGRSNVLVLVNGRRQTISASSEVSSQSETGVNLSSIPFSAIERVEIVMDGASSVYGADAIGGVINIILRNDYEGAELSVRYESGANGGDSIVFDGSYGHSWDDGNVTVSLSRKQKDPISAIDAGYTTQDFTSFGGYDGRSLFTGTQIGIFKLVDHPYWGPSPSLVGYLPLSDNGTAPLTAEDLALTSGRLETNLTGRLDTVSKYLSGENTNTAIAISAEHRLLEDDLKLYTELQYTKDEYENFTPVNIGLLRFPLRIGGPVTIPTSNAFNNTGEVLYLDGYFPSASVGAPEYQSSLTSDTRTGLVFGTKYQISSEWKVDASYQINKTESEYNNIEWRFDFDKLQALANSSDPSAAFNPFGNHSAQNDLSSAVISAPTIDSIQQPSISKIETFFVSGEGLLGSWAGGDIRMALGGELRNESLEFDDVFLIDGGSVGILSDSTPEREVEAVFAELFVPVFGKDNAIPGFQSLEFKFAGRNDKYVASEASAAVDNTYERFSPSVGFSWSPIEELRIRGNWGEAFRAPNLSQLYKTDSRTYVISGAYNAGFDPYLPEGADPRQAPPISLVQGANTDLGGETSTSSSIGIEWTPEYIDGLNVGISYNKTEISNQISNSNAIFLNKEYWAANFGPTGPNNAIVRDANGFISEMNTYPINIDGITADAVDFNIDYQFGDFDFTLNGTNTLSTVKHELNDDITLSGTDRGLPEWVGTFLFSWTGDDLSTTLAVNYTGEYHNIAGLGSTLNGGYKSFKDTQAEGLYEEMDAYTTVDFTARYFLSGSDMEITFGVKDLFEADKPFYNNSRGAPFDSRKVNMQGRTLFLTVKKEFLF